MRRALLFSALALAALCRAYAAAVATVGAEVPPVPGPESWTFKRELAKPAVYYARASYALEDAYGLTGRHAHVKTDLDEASRMDPSRIVCHRGDVSGGAAENSLTAFARAASAGFSLECDVRLDAKDRVCCAHDSLKGVDTPTLFSEVLPLARKGRWIVVDVKSRRETDEVLVQAIRNDLLAQTVASPENLFFICDRLDLLVTVRKILPDYKAMWLTGCALRGDFPEEAMSAEEVVGHLRETNASGVDLSDREEVFTKGYVARIAAAGYEVHMCTRGERKPVEDAFRRGALTVTPVTRAREVFEEMFEKKSSANSHPIPGCSVDGAGCAISDPAYGSIRPRLRLRQVQGWTFQSARLDFSECKVGLLRLHPCTSASPCLDFSKCKSGLSKVQPCTFKPRYGVHAAPNSGTLWTNGMVMSQFGYFSDLQQVLP